MILETRPDGEGSIVQVVVDLGKAGVEIEHARCIGGRGIPGVDEAFAFPVHNRSRIGKQLCTQIVQIELIRDFRLLDPIGRVESDLVERPLDGIGLIGLAVRDVARVPKHIGCRRDVAVVVFLRRSRIAPDRCHNELADRRAIHTGKVRIVDLQDHVVRSGLHILPTLQLVGAGIFVPVDIPAICGVTVEIPPRTDLVDVTVDPVRGR